MAATFAECDSRPGPVRDALRELRAAWIGVLECEASKAQRLGEIARRPGADDVAFEIDAVLAAANTSRNLTDDEVPLETARRLLRLRLAS